MTNREHWQRETLGTPKERKPDHRTPSGIPLQIVHGPDDLADWPGQYPFTRGIHSSMYRSRLWTMRQYAGFATARESNERYKYLLGQGQNGLSVAFDLPTQLAMDADDELARGEVGNVGVSISTLGDMRELFAEIPLTDVSTSMTINAPAAILLALYIAVAKEQAKLSGNELPPDVVVAKLRGTVQNDILKEFGARGLYVFPPRQSMRLVTDVFAFCQRNMPQWNTISISGYHIREAGSTAVQEVAFTLANGIAYVQGALDAGLAIDEFAGQLAFFFNAHNNFLEEVAKFRAARRMWAGIMRNRFGSKDARSQMLRFHAQTGGSTLTAQQPMNNVARVTIQALAAVLGGTQSLHTNGMDEALQLPSEEAVRTALRTQQIIGFESGVTDTVDPLGGSYVIEYLTDEIETRATELIERVDQMGGAVAAIENGWMQGQIAEASYAWQRSVERAAEIVVGVNQFQDEVDGSGGAKSQTIPAFRVKPEIEQNQRQRLAYWRINRDNQKCLALMHRLGEAARGHENVMPILVACAEGAVTVGEMGRVLRDAFGAYTPVGGF